MKVLTPEDKKYLGRVCRYLGSMGMERGEIQFEIEDNYFNKDRIDLTNLNSFNNNYSADIPEGLFPIIKRIINYSEKNWNDNVESIDYSYLNILIDCEEGSISSSQDYSYTEPNDSAESIWEEDEVNNDENLVEAFIALDDVSNGQNSIEVSYEGSGDSGYIESVMSNSEQVPTVVEDWCYSVLENLHGGWEINEGSRGTFIFELSPRKVFLNHTYYIQEHMTDTLWEEKF